MPDDFITLSNRLLNRCPAVGISLSQQLINDSWRTLQSRREWSFRRRSSVFAPPNVYLVGTVNTNAATGQPTLITGTGTSWTASMVGQQIRINGLLNPYFTITSVLSPTSLLIDQPWPALDVTGVGYQILKVYYSTPPDFGYFYALVSMNDGYQLWTGISQSELAMLDPQRTNTGQTYAASLLDYTPQFGGTIGPVMPVAATGAVPVSTTTTGYSFVANASYIVQILSSGISGTATFQWMRVGQTSFTGPVVSSDQQLDLMDGIQIYFPDNVNFVANDLFIINAQSQVTTSGPRYELWPAPTYSQYLYPYIYIAREYDITASSPSLPPFVANRGEVLLEMALAACARYPGADKDSPNIYFNLALATMHETKAERMIWDLERNDEEVGVTNISYQSWPFYPAPWADGSWQQTHAPFM